MRKLPTMRAMWLLVVLGFLAHQALAEQYGDVTVTAESPPSANTLHGYAEYRVTLFNKAAEKSHVVEVSIPDSSYGQGHHVRAMTRRMVVPPQTQTRVSLWQPPLMMYGSDLGVTIDGRRQELRVGLSTSNHGRSVFGAYYGGGPEPAFVLISRSVTGEVRDHLEQLVQKISGVSGSPAAGPFGSVSHSGPYASQWVRAETGASEYSVNWLAHSRYDAMIFTEADLRSMPSEAQRAVWSYVECGGSLLVFGEPPLAATWRERNADVQVGADGFARYDVGFGKVWSCDMGAAATWEEGELKLLHDELWRRDRQPPLSVQDANAKFPVVDNLQIPARGMLMMMIVFALVIGPVNLVVLTRMNKRMWTLVTVPVISLLFSVGVFAYATVSEGLSASGRMISVTVLDEGARQATTLGWLAYYSPLTPSGGLHFATTTELTPQIETSQWGEGSARLVDWTEDQHLLAGWIAARVPSHFTVRKSASHRERLSVHRDEDGQVTVVNGLGGPISSLYLADDAGQVYRAGHIAAGKKSVLERVDGSLATGVSLPLREIYNDGGRWLKAIERLSGPSAVALLRRGTYIAVMEESPFLERGLGKTNLWKAQAVVYGILPHGSSGE